MQILANFRPRVQFEIVTHIKRELLGNSKITIRKGMEVTPDDVLGKLELSAGYFSVNLSQRLEVSPSDADKYLQRPIGSKIYKGELLALRKGLFGKQIVTAPTDGILENYDREKGVIRLKYPARPAPLTSGVFGIVDDVNEVTGEILIKTVVTEVNGVLGAGMERGGVLNVLDSSSMLLNARDITPKMSKQIVVGGALIDSEALRQIAEKGVSGVISGGINARDFKAMVGGLDPMLRIGTDPGFSMLVTEGYGPMAIGDDIFRIINTHDGRFVFIQGNANRLLLPSTDADSIIRLRRVILPIEKISERIPELAVRPLEVGQEVRVIWPPFAGWQGTISAIDQSSTTLPSGISTYLITVETKGRKIRVPFPNVELIARNY